MTKYVKDMSLIIAMFIGIILISIATGGCAVPITPSNKIVSAPDYEAEAIEIIRTTLEDRLGITLYPPAVKINWIEGICMTGISYIYENPDIPECVTGLYTNRTWFYNDAIWILKRDKISDSTLAHELIHRFYDIYYSSDAGDINHSSDWWKEEPIANFYLREKGF